MLAKRHDTEETLDLKQFIAWLLVETKQLFFNMKCLKNLGSKSLALNSKICAPRIRCIFIYAFLIISVIPRCRYFCLCFRSFLYHSHDTDVRSLAIQNMIASPKVWPWFWAQYCLGQKNHGFDVVALLIQKAEEDLAQRTSNYLTIA